MADLKATLAARGMRYGAFDGHAKLTQTLKACVIAHDGGVGWGRMSAAQKEAMDMILHKIGRIVNGDPDYDDSWIDIAGYAHLVVDSIRESGVQRVAKIGGGNG